METQLLVNYPDGFGLKDVIWVGHEEFVRNGSMEIRFWAEGEMHRLVSHGLTVSPMPYQRSPTSAARYLAEAQHGNTGWLLQLLPANSETSSHLHKRKKESFYVLMGKVELYTPEEKVVLKAGDHAVILPQTIHQLATTTKSALLLLKIEGVNPLSMEDYQYHPLVS